MSAEPRDRPTTPPPLEGVELSREVDGSGVPHEVDGSGVPHEVEGSGIHPEVEDEEMVMHLERDQLVAETFRPVPRATLAPSAALGLWALRVFVVLVSAMVIYTFVARLH